MRDALDPGRIAAALGAAAAGLEVRVLARCGSTNSVLLDEAPARPVLLAAERQSAGRGRRGRRWHSAPGASLTLSLAQRLALAARDAGGLSLAAGVAVARALRALGAREVALKWPNDVVVRGAKLGGILVETRAAGTRLLAVIGIGLNCTSSATRAARLGRPVAALDALLRPLPSRNLLAGRIARELLDALAALEARGLGALVPEWERLHADAGQRLRVRLADGRVLAGVAEGVAADGALRLRSRGRVRAVHSGRVVSARAA